MLVAVWRKKSLKNRALNFRDYSVFITLVYVKIDLFQQREITIKI